MDNTVIPFKTLNFCILGKLPSDSKIIDKIWKYHILKVAPARQKLGFPFVVSKNSSYRPKSYELQKGRSGDSEHTYQPGPNTTGYGATDWTSNADTREEQLSRLKKMRDEFVETGAYSRIALYEHHLFLHCDHKEQDGDIYLYNEKWELIKRIPGKYKKITEKP